MFKMTPREALEIQRKQIAHYSKHRADLAEIMAAQNQLDGVDLDAPMDVVEINRIIPRGAAIEFACGLNSSGD